MATLAQNANERALDESEQAAKIEHEKNLADIEDSLIDQLKKLVDSPLFDVSPITLNEIKDIFNGLAERIDNWRQIAQEDKVRREKAGNQIPF